MFGFEYNLLDDAPYLCRPRIMTWWFQTRLDFISQKIVIRFFKPEVSSIPSRSADYTKAFDGNNLSFLPLETDHVDLSLIYKRINLNFSQIWILLANFNLWGEKREAVADKDEPLGVNFQTDLVSAKCRLGRPINQMLLSTAQSAAGDINKLFTSSNTSAAEQARVTISILCLPN